MMHREYIQEIHRRKEDGIRDIARHVVSLIIGPEAAASLVAITPIGELSDFLKDIYGKPDSEMLQPAPADDVCECCGQPRQTDPG